LLKLRGCFVLITMLLEIVQSVRVSRRAFSHKQRSCTQWNLFRFNTFNDRKRSCEKH